MTKMNSKYYKSIATLASGSMIAQIFTIICSPIITRLFTPESLGVYSLVTSAIMMFGTVMSFRYDMCIVSEPDEKKVYPLIRLALRICLILSTILTFGYLIYFSMISVDESPVILALITGSLVFLMGVINIITAYNNRQRDYKLITKTYVIRVFAQNICNIAAGFCNFGAIGLSLSHVIGYTAGVRGQCMPIWKKKKEILNTKREEMVQVFRENVNQATLSTPAALANGLSYSLINYFIEALFSSAIVGYYSITYRILGLPITVISINISRVFLEKASLEYAEKGDFQKTYKTTLRMLIALGIPMGVVLVWFAPWACEVFLGDGWGIAGVYIRILTPMFILRFIAGGVNTSAIIAKKQQIDLVIQVMLTAYSVGVFIFAKVVGLQIEVFLRLLSIGFCIIYIIYIILFGQCAKGNKMSNE